MHCGIISWSQSLLQRTCGHLTYEIYLTLGSSLSPLSERDRSGLPHRSVLLDRTGAFGLIYTRVAVA